MALFNFSRTPVQTPLEAALAAHPGVRPMYEGERDATQEVEEKKLILTAVEGFKSTRKESKAEMLAILKRLEVLQVEEAQLDAELAKWNI